MNIKVLALENDRAKLIIQGAGHTFMNVLTEEILEDPDVDVAKYHIEFHFSDPELLVTTNGKKEPLEVIKDACTRLSGQCADLLAQIPSD
jgi:DNA-directed RNA polymerase subunit L